VLRPGLAAAWTRDGTGLAWTFTLRQGARFSDGSPVTAAAVLSAWKDRRAPLKQVGIDSVVVLDDQRLTVTLHELRDSVPRLFADPALAVTRANDSTLATTARTAGPGSANVSALDFQAATGDPRDAIDRGADLVVTRNPALVEYATSRRELANFPLPWSRTYVLLQHSGTEVMDPRIYQDSVRRSLARDAVPAEARAAEAPFWWNSPALCTTDVSIPVKLPTSQRIVYPSGDEVARGLAERIVALARVGVELRTAALKEADFAASLRSGGERGYIVALPRQALAPCRESAALPPGALIQPLIDTRAHAIVRRGAPPLTVEWDGTIRVLVDNGSTQELP
jgi:hypothetical protein